MGCSKGIAARERTSPPCGLRISDFGLLSAFDLRPSDFRLRRPVPFDNEYAHKPWVIFHNGVVYHFYCACGDQGRVIAVATSKDLKK